MTAKFFADSNVVLYTIGKDPRKTEIARAILARRPVISTQVVNESINVCLRKLSFAREQAYVFGRAVMDRSEVLAVDEPTLDRAAALAIRHQLSHWDALIYCRCAARGLRHPLFRRPAAWATVRGWIACGESVHHIEQRDKKCRIRYVSRDAFSELHKHSCNARKVLVLQWPRWSV